MRKKQLTTILIDNYNYGGFIKDAIDSALNQSYPHTEVIVVDDGSTDNSREIIASYGDKIVPILKENGGQASAFNAGFAASRGEIIFLLDSDDIFLQNKVAEVMEKFENSPEIGWCFHPQKWVDSDRNEIVAAAVDLESSREYDFRPHLKRGKLNPYLPAFGLPATSAFCFRRSLLEQILPMPQAQNILMNDNYLKFLALALAKGFVINEKLSIQRIHPHNAFTQRSDRTRLGAKSDLLTAYWMRVNFPVISQYTNNTLASVLSRYWHTGGVEAEAQTWINKYLSQTSWRERITIYLKSLYYSLKWQN